MLTMSLCKSNRGYFGSKQYRISQLVVLRPFATRLLTAPLGERRALHTVTPSQSVRQSVRVLWSIASVPDVDRTIDLSFRIAVFFARRDAMRGGRADIYT